MHSTQSELYYFRFKTSQQISPVVIGVSITTGLCVCWISLLFNDYDDFVSCLYLKLLLCYIGLCLWCCQECGENSLLPFVKDLRSGKLIAVCSTHLLRTVCNYALERFINKDMLLSQTCFWVCRFSWLISYDNAYSSFITCFFPDMNHAA